MPGTVTPRWGTPTRFTPLGSSTSSASRLKHWLAKGFDSEEEAEAAVRAETPKLLGIVPLSGVRLVDRPGRNVYGFEAEYELASAAQVGGPGDGSGDADPAYNYQWDIGTETKKLLKSYHTDAFPAEGEAPDFDGAILVKPDGTVEGVDVEDGCWTEEIQFFLKPERVTTDLKRRLYLLRQTVNDAPFLYFDTGECRFRGCRASAQKGENTSITLLFAAASNEEIPHLNGEDVFDKAGQDFLWYSRKSQTIDVGTGPAAAKLIVAKATCAFVEQVYRRRSFELLQALIDGIGTGDYVDPAGDSGEGSA